MNNIVIIASVVTIYTYCIYPLLLCFICLFKNKNKYVDFDEWPFVSVIIPVHNAEMSVARKMQNLFSQSYPNDKMEIICVSDNSTDMTNDILDSISGVRVIELGKRVGKEKALKMGVSQSCNELICFTDVDTHINYDGISNMVRHFSDESIGAVSSIDKIDPNESVLEKIHVFFVNKLRAAEGCVSSCTGVSGSFFMARRELVENIGESCCSDLAVSFECMMSNYRSIVEPNAYGVYKKSVSIQVELRRKVRTVAQGMGTLYCYKKLLNPLVFNAYSLQLISHKILRWISPLAFLMMFLFYTAMILENISIDVIYFGMALIVFVLVFFPSIRKKVLNDMQIIILYVLVPILSLYFFLTKKDFRVWEPTERSDKYLK